MVDSKKEDLIRFQTSAKLKEETLNRLQLLKEDDIKQISSLYNHFLSQTFSIKNKSTPEEIKQELEKKSLSLKTKEKIWDYLEELSEAEYSQIDKNNYHDKNLIPRLKHLVELIFDEEMGKHKLLSEKKIVDNLIHPEKIVSYFQEKKKETAEIDKDYQMLEIFNLVKKAHSSLSNNDEAAAKKTYSQILKIYTTLPNSNKKQIYFHINKLYEKFSLKTNKK